MTSRQCVANLVCLVCERLHWLRRILRFVAGFMFPSFTRLPIGRHLVDLGGWRLLIGGYLFVWIVLFGVQGLLAFSTGMFFPDSNPATKTFLEDKENLLDYLVICQAYCILAFLFLRQSYSMGVALSASGLQNRLTLPALPESRAFSLIGGVSVLLIALFGSAGYAIEIKGYSAHYWFMASGPPDITLGLSGYYYVFVNLLLLLLVTWAGAAHFGLFLTAGSIAQALRPIHRSDEDRDLSFWLEKDRVKALLAPFSWHVLTSKALILTLAINMLTWKRNEANVGMMYAVSVVIIAAFGIWVFALPRYFIQYHVFRIWQRSGREEYVDLRVPWVVGISAVIDIILITIVIRTLLGEAASKVLEHFFS